MAVRPRQQRAAVRITYGNRKTPGLWRAHGVYLQRESAAGEYDAGFSETETGIKLAAQLDTWQKAGDPRLFKVILSPEFGERFDLQNYTRKVMARMETELGRPVHWMATVHHNTDHPHVHVVLRSIDKNNQEFLLPKEFVRHTAREIAQEVATQEIGFRTELDLQQARAKEIDQNRVTSLDREIDKHRDVSNEREEFGLVVETAMARAWDRERVFALERRLSHLAEIGLAQRTNRHEWSIDSQFVAKLRTIQQTGDRQKSMARQMALASAPNLAVVFDNWQDVSALRGRILGHGEEEGSGRHYFLLEATDGKVHYLTHRKETENERHNGQLKTNSFVGFRNDGIVLHIQHYGDAEDVLQSKRFLSREPPGEHLQGDLPGWLGRYAQAVSHHQTFDSNQRQSEQENAAMPLKLPKAIKRFLGDQENEKTPEKSSPEIKRDSLLKEVETIRNQWVSDLNGEETTAPYEVIDKHFENRLNEINRSLEILRQSDPSIQDRIDIQQMQQQVWRESEEEQDRLQRSLDNDSLDPTDGHPLDWKAFDKEQEAVHREADYDLHKRFDDADIQEWIDEDRVDEHDPGEYSREAVNRLDFDFLTGRFKDRETDDEIADRDIQSLPNSPAATQQLGGYSRALQDSMDLLKQEALALRAEWRDQKLWPNAYQREHGELVHRAQAMQLDRQAQNLISLAHSEGVTLHTPHEMKDIEKQSERAAQFIEVTGRKDEMSREGTMAARSGFSMYEQAFGGGIQTGLSEELNISVANKFLDYDYKTPSEQEHLIREVAQIYRHHALGLESFAVGNGEAELDRTEAADYDLALDYDPAVELEEQDEDDLDEDDLDYGGGTDSLSEPEQTTGALREQYQRTIDDLAFGPRESTTEAMQDSNKAQDLNEQQSVPEAALLPDTALGVDLVHSEQEYEANSMAAIDDRDPLDTGSRRAEEELAYYRGNANNTTDKSLFEPDTEHGAYIGELVAETDHFFVQQDGDRLILHEKDKLAPSAHLGSHVIVQYDPALETAKVVEIPEYSLEQQYGLEV